MERKKNPRNLQKREKNIHISHCEGNAVGPVRCASHTASPLMSFHLKWPHFCSILSHIFEEWGNKQTTKSPNSLEKFTDILRILT